MYKTIFLLYKLILLNLLSGKLYFKHSKTWKVIADEIYTHFYIRAKKVCKIKFYKTYQLCDA